MQRETSTMADLYLRMTLDSPIGVSPAKAGFNTAPPLMHSLNINSGRNDSFRRLAKTRPRGQAHSQSGRRSFEEAAKAGSTCLKG